MTQKNFVELLGPGGQMRDYFVQACGGADWVAPIYDEVVTQLKEIYCYFPIADEKEMGGWIQWLEQHPRFIGMSQFRVEDGWQVSIAVDSPTNMMVVVRPLLIDCMYTAFAQFAQYVAVPNG